MSNPYTSQTIANYNDGGIPDDGTVSELNRVKLQDVIDDLADPIKNFVTAVNTAVTDAFDNAMIDVTSSTTQILQAFKVEGAVTFNDTGADVDFRVEGDTEENLLFCDASTDCVGFGTNTPLVPVHIVGTQTALFRVEQDSTGASAGPIISLVKDQTDTPGAGDFAGEILFKADDSANSIDDVSRILAQVISPTAGSVSGKLRFDVMKSGAFTQMFDIGPTGVIANDVGDSDFDFRVESDNNTHAVFVDASTDRVGFGTSTPAVPVEIRSTSASIFKVSADIANASSGPEIRLQKYHTDTPADDNVVGVVSFYGKDEIAEGELWSQIKVYANDVTDSSECGRFEIVVPAADTDKVAFALDAPAGGSEINAVVGDGALATTATDGFLYIPSSAGPPTGTPTAYTGRVPLHYDSTNNNLYVYDGSWLSVGVS